MTPIVPRGLLTLCVMGSLISCASKPQPIRTVTQPPVVVEVERYVPVPAYLSQPLPDVEAPMPPVTNGQLLEYALRLRTMYDLARRHRAAVRELGGDS